MVPVGFEGLATINPCSGPFDRIEQLGRRLEAVLGLARQQHRLDAERGKDIAIGGIARRRERDPVADIEGGEETEQESARGTGRNHDPVRIDLDPVSLPVVTRETLA